MTTRLELEAHAYQRRIAEALERIAELLDIKQIAVNLEIKGLPMDTWNRKPYDDDRDECRSCGVPLDLRPLVPVRHEPDCPLVLDDNE